MPHTQILDRSHEVAWRDGSKVELHHVQVNGAPDTYLRAIHHKPDSWAIFDLRKVARQLGEDIAGAPHRDAPGLVFYTLRQAYATAADFTAAALRVASTVWAMDLAAEAHAT